MESQFSNRNSNLTSPSAGLAGLLIGAITGATVVALSNKESRRRLSKWSEETSRKAQSVINEAAGRVNTIIEQTRKSARQNEPSPSRPVASDEPASVNGGGERLLNKPKQD